MIRTLISALILAVSAVGAWGAGPWLEDWDAARKAALAGGKPILVAVTSADAGAPCSIMEAEIYSQPQFLAEAPKQYILFRIDLSRSVVPTERLRVQNKAWLEANPVEALPSTFVFDSRGTLLGRKTGLVDGGVPTFLALAAEMTGRQPVLEGLKAAATQATAGAAKAQAWDALFRQAEAWDLTVQYGDLPMRIIQEDKDGKAGLKPYYQAYNAYNRLLAIWADQPDYRKVIADLEQLSLRTEPWPALRQRVVFTKAMVLLNALDDETAAREAFRQARDLAAGSPVGLRAAEFLDRLP